MKSMNLKMGFVMAAAAALLFGASCVAQQEDASDSEAATSVEQSELTAEKSDGEVGVSAVASFYSTCTSPSVTFEPGTGDITYAFAKECKKRNGSWYQYPQTWTGRCRTNLGNCDGILKCGC